MGREKQDTLCGSRQLGAGQRCEQDLASRCQSNLRGWYGRLDTCVRRAAAGVANTRPGRRIESESVVRIRPAGSKALHRRARQRKCVGTSRPARIVGIGSAIGRPHQEATKSLWRSHLGVEVHER